MARLLCILPDAGQGPVEDRTGRIVESLAKRHQVHLIIGSAVQPAQRAALDRIAPGAPVVDLPEVALRSNRGRLQWLLQRHVALEVALTDPRPARARADEVIRAGGPYDGVVVSGIPLLWALRLALPPRPLVVDLPVVHSRPTSAGPTRSALLDRIERDRWFRFELRYAATAHMATVPSDADREALGVPGAVVVTDAEVPSRYAGEVERVLASAAIYAPKGGG